MVSPNIWVFIYLIQLLLLSLALGSWALHQPRLLMVPRISRFLIGFCITPFVLGVWMLLMATVLPGAPTWLFVLPPSVLAIALLALYGPRILRRLRRDWGRTPRLCGRPWVVYFTYFATAMLIAMVTCKLVTNGRPPVSGHDGLVYLGQALAFAEERSICATTSFRGWPDGTIRGTSHSFLFPAFLAHALITTGRNPIGYPYDHAVRAAFQITLMYMLLSVVALAGMARYRGTSALVLILLLQVPMLGYISHNQSRDAFRIIPLMLLATVLTGLSPQTLRDRLRRASLLPPLILAAFSLSGHTLGGIVVVTITLAWMTWGIVQRARWLNLLLVCGAITVGLLVSGSHYATAYLETGTLAGDTVFRDNAIVGTALSAANVEQNESRLEGTRNAIERLTVLVARDGYRLSLPGLLGAMGAIAVWARPNREKRLEPVGFVGLIVLATTLPFIVPFDFSAPTPLSKWFVMNPRYALHWYPFAAVCVAMLVGYACDKFVQRFSGRLRIIISVGAVLLALGATFSAGETIASQWRTMGPADTRFVENARGLEAMVCLIPSGKRLLLDDPRYNYYLGNQAIVMYSRPTWEIIQAKSESEAQSAFEELDIGAVALSNENIFGWWDQIALFSFLNDPNNMPLFVSGALAKSDITVYMIDEEVVRRLEALDEAAVRNAMEVALLHLDFSAIETEGNTTYAVSTTGEKATVQGTARLADGPAAGCRALVVDDTSRLTCPSTAIKLSQGSLSVWARLTTPENQQISGLAGVNANRDLRIRHRGADGRVIVFYNGVKLSHRRVAITDDEWHHYVFTWRDGKQEFYIDGLQGLSDAVRATTSATELFTIGWLGNHRDPQSWRGLLADLITFARPLSDDEVAALYRVRLRTGS